MWKKGRLQRGKPVSYTHLHVQAPVKIVNENVLDVQCIYTADGTLGVNPSECDETDGFSSKLKVFDRFGGTMPVSYTHLTDERAGEGASD